MSTAVVNPKDFTNASAIADTVANLVCFVQNTKEVVEDVKKFAEKGIKRSGLGAIDGFLTGLYVMPQDNSLLMYNKNKSDVEVSHDIQKIHQGAFSGKTKLETVKIHTPEDVLVNGIATDAEFAYKQGLYKFEIGAGTFENCEKLAKVVLPDFMTELSDKLFKDCTLLTEVNIPETVTKIGDFTFQNCNNVAVPSLQNIESIGKNAFQSCMGLEKADLTKCEGIGMYAFENCPNLKSIEFSEKITEIPDFAFANCSGLTSVVIPDKVDSISENAFRNCKNIRSIEVSSKHLLQAFKECRGLEEINVRDGEKMLTFKLDPKMSRTDFRNQIDAIEKTFSVLRNPEKFEKHFSTLEKNEAERKVQFDFAFMNLEKQTAYDFIQANMTEALKYCADSKDADNLKELKARFTITETELQTAKEYNEYQDIKADVYNSKKNNFESPKQSLFNSLLDGMKPTVATPVANSNTNQNDSLDNEVTKILAETEDVEPEL